MAVTVSRITPGSGGDFIAGSFVQAVDGSETPITLTAEPFGVRVIDGNALDRDVDLERLLIAGVIQASLLVEWPSDTALRQWVIDQLQAVGIFVVVESLGL